MATLTSKLIVQLIDRATGPARAIAAGVNRLTAMQSRNAAALATAQSQMFGAAAVAYGLAKAIGAPVNAAVDFETKLEDIGQKINAPVSDLPKLGEELRAVARQTTQTASQMAEGMDVLAGMGASREDALGLLPAIGRAATAYNAEVSDLSQAGYTALDNLKVPANQFAGALDAMAQAGKEGAFELKDMAKYFPKLGAGYQALGQTGVPAVADLSAALQIVRKGTGDSASAATNLSNILQKINSPLTRKNFAKMGVNLTKEMKRAAKAGMTPIEAIAALTNKVLKGDLSRLGDLFNDAQVQEGLRPLIQNIEEYRRIRKEALAAQGVVEQDYQRRLKTGASAIQRFRIALEGINLAIGAALLPGLTDLADAIVPLMNRMATFAEKHPAVTRAVVATAAGLIGLRIAGIAAKFGLLWMWGGALVIAKGAMLGLAGAIRLVTSATKLLRLAVIGTGIGAVLVAIGAAGMFIYNNWKKLPLFFESFKRSLMENLGPGAGETGKWLIDKALEAYKRFDNLTGTLDDGTWRRWGAAAGEASASIVNYLTNLASQMKPVVDEIINVWKQGDWAGLGAYIGSAIWQGIKSNIGNLFSFLWNGPAGGNPIGKALTGMKNGPNGDPGADPNRPSVPISKRAAGGPVRSGGTYLVGERGPELFRAATSGHITNTLDTVRAIKAQALAGAARGGVTNVGGISINVSAAPGQSPEAIASAVERKLSEKLAALSRGAFSDGVY